jgi:hypothetical protein
VASLRRGATAVLTLAGPAMRRRVWQVYTRAVDALFDCHLHGAEAVCQLRIIAAAPT